ncbi:uncharacterized protein LOC114915625 [Cajanus cajan]|uniref:uncharacterized protein LOC114915625 n=1 Tax=Cajanus cajan TaxID=3821 RepID=UPI0010FB0545|nr:uncharacterized protein LOC114915625 [Cajanus cajan]
MSTMEVLVRTKVSILLPSWDHVEEVVKNHIWADITETWDIPRTEDMRRKTLSIVAERWRAYKTSLTNNYIFGKKKGEFPGHKNPTIDQETWNAFVESRMTKEFLEKRKKVQEIQTNNDTIVVMEEKKLMKEKAIKRPASQDATTVSGPPSPPTRYKLWKHGRIKKMGEFTTEATKVIANKIDILEQKSTEGSFVSHGCQDILTTTIGKPEHPGRVRDAGGGHSLQTYFGSRSSSQTSGTVDQLVERKVSQVMATYEKKFSQMQEEIHKRLQEDMQRQLQEHMQSLRQQFQQSTPIVEPFIARVSTKGSCASIDPPVTATGPGTSNKCELFVDGSLDPVGIRKIHILGSTVHHQVMGDDMIRVSVLDVRQPEARVPVPTEEVQTMRQALNTFLQWPHKLVKVISTKDIVTSPKGKGTVIVTPSRNLLPIKRLWRLVADMEDDEQPKQLPWPPEVFNMSSKVPLYISQSDISEITNGHCMLNISILQLWLLFIHKLSMDKGNDHIYGFLEPESIQKSGNKVEEIQAYIQNWMFDSNKKVYLAPYFSDAHWQLLVICPMDNIAVCICSLHKPPPMDFRQLLDRAMEGYHILKGSKMKKKMSWVSPKSHKQKGNYECGYYVMKTMHTIVDSQIVSGWTEIFIDRSPLPLEDINIIREQWATFFINYYFN